jgi:hypothetical protein
VEHRAELVPRKRAIRVVHEPLQHALRLSLHALHQLAKPFWPPLRLEQPAPLRRRGPLYQGEKRTAARRLVHVNQRLSLARLVQHEGERHVPRLSFTTEMAAQPRGDAVRLHERDQFQFLQRLPRAANTNPPKQWPPRVDELVVLLQLSQELRVCPVGKSVVESVAT